MQGEWLIHKNRDALLIFYNGWGMDAFPFAHLESQWLDVYLLNDYRDLRLPTSLGEMSAPYSEVHVLAWSLGVWAAARTSDAWPTRLASATALNGTLAPIHSRFGIPPAVFDSTLDELTDATRTLFYGNMFSNEAEGARFLAQAPRRPLEEIRAELAHLRTEILTGAPDFVGGLGQPFGRVLIGLQDRIIPAAAQRRFWQEHPSVRRLDAGHFPFYAERNWEGWLNHESA